MNKSYLESYSDMLSDIELIEAYEQMLYKAGKYPQKHTTFYGPLISLKSYMQGKLK